MSQQRQDDKELARQALGSAVASYGVSVLSDPQALREALTRLLPNSPVERSLLSAAAGAGVASRLRRHIQEGCEDSSRAVQAVARELAERTAIDMGACLWVTAEFDRVLGYPGSSAITLAYAPKPLADDQLPPVQPEPQPWVAPQPGIQPPVSQPGVQQPGVEPGGWWQMPPGQVPPGPVAPVPGYRAPRRPWNRGRVILTVAAAVVVALGGYAGAAAATHLFPFRRVDAAPLPRPSFRPAHHQPTATPIPSATSSVAALPSGTAPLTALLPGVLDDPASQCSPILPPYHWTMSGVVQALQCDQVPGLRNGTVFAFQLDSASNYLTAWGNYNRWWGFDRAAAGTSCPPGSAAGEGTVSWSGHFFPRHEGQVLECEGVSGNQPAYTWTMPTEYAFIVAQGAPGSSFAALQTWWTDDAGPNTAPGPATP